jgi:hypothetical protein
MSSSSCIYYDKFVFPPQAWLFQTFHAHKAEKEAATLALFWAPISVRAMASAIFSAVSRAACALRWASDRTSLATYRL